MTSTANVYTRAVKEPLIYSEVPEAQGCAANIQSLKRLNIEEKRKSHFCFSSLKNIRDEFFRVILVKPQFNTANLLVVLNRLAKALL